MTGRERSSAPGASAAKWLAVVVLVTLAGAAVRLVGIQHGVPSEIFHPDVAKQALIAGAVYRGKSNPTVYFRGDFMHRLYPYGTSVLLGRLLRTIDPVRFGVGDPADPAARLTRWRWALRLRLFSAASWLGAVAFVLYALRGELRAGAGLIAGLLLVLEPWSAELGHYGMNDVPLTAMLLVAWIAAGWIGRQGWPGLLASVLAGLALGLGFAVKYQAVLGFVFPVTAWILLARARLDAFPYGSAVTLLASFLAGAMLASSFSPEHWPYVLQELPRFLAWQANITGQELPHGDRIARNIGWLGRFFAANGAWILVLGAVGAVFRSGADAEAVERRIRMSSAMVFVVALPLLLVLSRDFMRPNDLLPMLPFLVLLPASWLGRRGAGDRANLVLAVVGLALVAGFANVAARDALALARPDTRIRAREWCRQELPPGTSVLRERYVLPIEGDGIRERSVRDLGSDEARQALRAGEPDVVITSSHAHERFFDRFSSWFDPAVQKRYRALEKDYRVAASFEDRTLTVAHPKVVVYVRR